MLLVLLAMGSFQAVYANSPKLSIHITGVNQAKQYYLCIYGVGCLNMRASNQLNTYDIAPMNMGNITKLVVTNLENRQMYPQAINDTSCNVTVGKNQKIIISGHLNLENDKPSLTNIHCSIV